MYYHLAEICNSSGGNEQREAIYERFLDLAQKTYGCSNGLVKIILGKPWSPFAQRHLICNLGSSAHVNQNDDLFSLNSLTFYGNAELWLIAIINNEPYAFCAEAGVTLLFPASLFVHLTSSQTQGDQYVLTNWTSNQLGYRGIIQAAAAGKPSR